MLPVLKTAAVGEVRINNVIELLANEFALSDEECSQLLPLGKQTTFANLVHWAKSYLQTSAKGKDPLQCNGSLVHPGP
jgi:restriction system protein